MPEPIVFNTSAAKRDRILLNAQQLFNQHGATSVDTVFAAAGVTKVSLSRHFPAKNALFIAFLQQ